ncbi:MAG: hypothetical protein RLZZ539_1464, partial [Pseudomonadota bacterium]
ALIGRAATSVAVKVTLGPVYPLTLSTVPGPCGPGGPGGPWRTSMTSGPRIASETLISSPPSISMMSGASSASKISRDGIGDPFDDGYISLQESHPNAIAHHPPKSLCQNLPKPSPRGRYAFAPQKPSL